MNLLDHVPYDHPVRLAVAKLLRRIGGWAAQPESRDEAWRLFLAAKAAELGEAPALKAQVAAVARKADALEQQMRELSAGLDGALDDRVEALVTRLLAAKSRKAKS